MNDFQSALEITRLNINEASETCPYSKILIGNSAISENIKHNSH